MIAQSWGGIMAGASYSPGREHPRRYRATGQCGFAFMFQVGLFIDPDEYGREMDALAARLRDPDSELHSTEQRAWSLSVHMGAVIPSSSV